MRRRLLALCTRTRMSCMRVGTGQGKGATASFAPAVVDAIALHSMRCGARVEHTHGGRVRCAFVMAK